MNLGTHAAAGSSQMSRVSGIASAVAACVLCCALGGGCSQSDGDGVAGGGSAKNLKKHNVLLVTLDTTRVDYLSCYDASKGELTPNFDAVAADAVRFDFAIAQSAGTPMSHASILSGLNPYQHGVRVISAAGGYKLSPRIATLTTVLKQHGWTTAAFLSAFTVSEYYGFDNGFDTFDNGLTQDAGTIVEDIDGGFRRWDQRRHQRRSDRTVDRALAWLQAKRSQPFFMWVHLWDPHDRMVLPPEEVLARFTTPGLAEDDYKRAIYRAECYYMDTQFGRLLEALKQGGQYDHTVMVIVADHGQGLGQHDWWSHRLLYQEDLHVPLLMRVPGWPRGRVVPELVRTVDIYPTVLESLGISVPGEVAGMGLRGLVAGESESPRVAYADQINKYDLVSAGIAEGRPKDDLLYCAMDRTWKLIYRYSYPDESELYNLAEDPHELKNLFARQPAQVRRLQAILDEHDGYVTAPFTEAELPDDATLRALQSLGYVGSSEDDDEPNTEKATTQPTTQPTTLP
jgi:arylsulfatase A-like enzyme